MKIGILGGTFDPIHTGHLIVAETIRSDVGLDRVLFIPTFIQPYKPGGPEVDSDSRYQMVKLALEGHSGFTASDIEIRRGGISYTLDTLNWFRQSEMGQGNEVFLILGMDSLIDMKNWKQPEDIIKLATLLVAARPGYDDSQVEAWIKVQSVMVSTPRVDISSTEIRKRIHDGKSVRFWVPECVEHHIIQKGLYR